MEKLSPPMSIIKKSLQLFFTKANLVYFLKIYSVLIPFSLLTFFQDKYFATQAENLSALNFGTLFNGSPWVIYAYIIIGIIYLVLSFWVSAAGIFAVDKVVTGGTLDAKAAFSETKRLLWPYSLLLILLAVITGIGFILLIVPGVLFMVWYSFTGFELITKSEGIKLSMKKSKELVVGRFWPVFGRIALYGLFTMLFQIAISLLPFSIGTIISPLLGALLVLPYFLLYKELS